MLSRGLKGKRFKLIVFIFVLSMLLAQNVYAGGGGGNGGGSGGGSGSGSGNGNSSQSDALTLTSSNPVNGQNDFPVAGQLKFVFSNNVVNMSVKDANLKCFSLKLKNGTLVSIKVNMADDQMAPDKKREITVVPSKSLLPNTEYTIKISSKLASKNGTVLGKEISIKFTTAALKKAGNGQKSK